MSKKWCNKLGKKRKKMNNIDNNNNEYDKPPRKKRKKVNLYKHCCIFRWNGYIIL